jgi:hypothetical protein
VFVLDSPDEMAVVMDYCLYDVRRQGRNTIERFAADFPPADAEEMLILQGMQQARFSLFRLEGSEPGAGVSLRDLLHEKSFFVMDIGFSNSRADGLALAVRLLPVEGMYMTTGAALPLGMLPDHLVGRVKQALTSDLHIHNFDALSPEKESAMTGSIIRMCLELGATEHIAYNEPGSPAPHPLPGPGFGRGHPSRPLGRDMRRIQGRAPGTGRNDRGRKYKHCCGKR